LKVILLSGKSEQTIEKGLMAIHKPLQNRRDPALLQQRSHQYGFRTSGITSSCPSSPNDIDRRPASENDFVTVLAQAESKAEREE